MHDRRVHPLEHGDFQRGAVRLVRQDHREPAAQRGPEPPGLGAVGADYRGTPVRKQADYFRRPGAGEHLLPVRRPGRELLYADPGHYPGRGPAGRGGAHAPVLRGTGPCPVLHQGKQDMVQLQPGRPRTLVL